LTLGVLRGIITLMDKRSLGNDGVRSTHAVHQVSADYT
jgi:hypothetical protein